MSDVFIDWLKRIEYGDKMRQALKNILNAHDYSLVKDEDIIEMYTASKINSSVYYEEKQSLLIKAAFYAGASTEEVCEMINNLEEMGWHFHPNIELEISNEPDAKLTPESINYILKTVGKDEKIHKVSDTKKNK